MVSLRAKRNNLGIMLPQMSLRAKRSNLGLLLGQGKERLPRRSYDLLAMTAEMGIRAPTNVIAVNDSSQ